MHHYFIYSSLDSNPFIAKISLKTHSKYKIQWKTFDLGNGPKK